MKLNNTSEVKKWLRNIPLIKKELKLKTAFYKELAEDAEKQPDKNKRCAIYKYKITELQKQLDMLLADTERLFGLLDEPERLVMTARYIKSVKWDFIELHSYYSRRHAIRVHNNALQKLVGQTVEDIEL